MDVNDPGRPAPPLLADAMLGKLARWLRALGYDTLYLQVTDAEIAHRARVEGRILLTQDRQLARRRGLRTVLITSQDLVVQVSEVLAAVGPPPVDSPRCMVCNGALERISHDEAAKQVPAYVAATQEDFRRCVGCGRIYWQGTHWDGIRERIARVLVRGHGSGFG